MQVNESNLQSNLVESEQNVVLCMKWGTKYGADYVNRLYNMVKRHTTVDFKMVCLTDRTGGLTPKCNVSQFRHWRCLRVALNVVGINFRHLNPIFMV